MKIDLTNLSLDQQIAAVVDLLRRLSTSGSTAAPELQRHFKHRAFRTPAQRRWHFHNLLVAAVLAVSGREKDFQRVYESMQRATVILEPGDACLHDGHECRVVDVLPDGKLGLFDKALGDYRVALSEHVRPLPIPARSGSQLFAGRRPGQTPGL